MALWKVSEGRMNEQQALADYKETSDTGGKPILPVDFSFSGNDVKAQEEFEILKIKDRIKKSYCKKNKITLLTISYKKFNEIDSIIQKI
jgi:hypothetical protein